MRKAIIPGTNDRYWVSDDGRVYDTLTHSYKTMTDDKKGEGYLVTQIQMEDGNLKTVRIHRLVAELLVPGYSEELVVNHINENKHDNRAKNLEWVTRSQNCRHRGANLRSAAHRSRRVLVCKPDNSFAKIFDSVSAAIRELGVNPWNASGAVRGRRKSAAGYLFSYVDRG